MKKNIHSIGNQYFVKVDGDDDNCKNCHLNVEKYGENFYLCNSYTDVSCGGGKHYKEVFLVDEGVYKDSKGNAYTQKKLKQHIHLWK